MSNSGTKTSEPTGILPSQALRTALELGWITAEPLVEESQIQPASVDLRLGAVAHRVRASFLPGQSSVAEKLSRHRLYTVELGSGSVLEQDCIHIIPLQERLNLPAGITAQANPKSSTGRLDIFARVITDHGEEFDHVRSGYRGPLYVEIAPRSFPIRVREGSRLVQLRLRRGSGAFTEAALRRLQARAGLIIGDPDQDYVRGRRIVFTADLRGDGQGSLVGYRARRGAGLIDVDEIGGYEWRSFWDPVIADADGVVLSPNDFYLLASKESVAVPPDHAAEMIASDTQVGEFRVHYAGFFDPGFGTASEGGEGSRAVLEVRARDVPFIIEDGQFVGHMEFERLTARPDKLYGSSIASTYQGQRLQLGKQFRR